MKKLNLDSPITKRDAGEKLRIEIRRIWKKMGEEIKKEIEQSGNRIINRLESHLPKKE